MEVSLKCEMRNKLGWSIILAERNKTMHHTHTHTHTHKEL